MTNRPMQQIIVRREPVTLPPEATVQEASRTMRDQRVGAVLVTDAAGLLVGIFTGRDAVWRLLAEDRDPARTTLAEAMTSKPVTVGPRVKAIEALRLMQDCGIRHLPVAEETRVLGAVARGISVVWNKRDSMRKPNSGSGSESLPRRPLAGRQRRA